MSALMIINDIKVEFISHCESVFINSIDLSKVFEKRHDNVLKDIENLPNDKFKDDNFIKSSYKDSRGRVQPCYNLTKDGFCLLVMGFTGEKAYRWKVEFLKAFNLLLDENRRLKFSAYVDKIANLQAINISKERHHNQQINGYKSQIIQHNEQIINLKIKLDEIDREKSIFELKFKDAVFYATKEILNENCKSISDKAYEILITNKEWK